MDGRKAVAAGFLALATTACAPWGPFVVAGGLSGFATEVSESAPEANLEAPRLGKIFRDGRYEFGPAPATVQRQAERRFRRDPAARQAFRKLAVKMVVDAPGGTPIVTFAIVWKKAAAAHPAAWEEFLAGYTTDNDVELTRGTMRGANVAFGDQRDARVVLVDHSDRVTLMVVGPPNSSMAPLKDVARYLLRSS
ncbi:MAG: hypothetical protein M3134_05075 [Actinomycetota bacterium]|nr:hypothetical protein [Actinomycetota bacterium]